MIRTMTPVLAVIIVSICISACTKDVVNVPIVVDRPLPPKPDECTSASPSDLAEMPKAKPSDTIEAYVASVGRIHRQNRSIYRRVRTDKATCGTYVSGLKGGK